MSGHHKKDAIVSIQAMMQEVDRILLRAALDNERGISGDTKNKIAWMLDDIKRRMLEL